MTRMMAARPIDEEFRTGWPVVFACFATAVFAWGFVSYGQPVYLAELQRTHGWSAGTIGGATTVSFVIGAGLLPWVGWAIERLGARAACPVAPFSWEPVRSASAMRRSHGSSIHAMSSWALAGRG